MTWVGIAAELISNALLHTRSGGPGGCFLVEVGRRPCAARVVVYDLGGGGLPRFDMPRQRDEAREHGYGLCGVAALAVEVGLSGDPITGHAVWARLALNPTMLKKPPH
jgi:anti-sigma regulatory factor (Ser/Thr protein kinase)